jgi:hypothetical protein
MPFSNSASASLSKRTLVGERLAERHQEYWRRGRNCDHRASTVVDIFSHICNFYPQRRQYFSPAYLSYPVLAVDYMEPKFKKVIKVLKIFIY